MKNERVALLEEKLAWLQRHATEQDRVMLKMAEDMARLTKKVMELRTKLGEEPGESLEAGERPPHD